MPLEPEFLQLSVRVLDGDLSDGSGADVTHLNGYGGSTSAFVGVLEVEDNPILPVPTDGHSCAEVRHGQRIKLWLLLYPIPMTSEKRDKFLQIWESEGSPKEKALKATEVLGEEAGALAQELLGVPKALFVRGGVVKADESLIITGGEFKIPFNIEVEPGGELVISPGTVLKFAPKTGIVCHGLLRIIGNPQERVRLLPQEPAEGWAGVRLEGPDTWGSVLTFCEIAEARGMLYEGDEEVFGGGLLIADTKIVKVHACIFRECRADYGAGLMAVGVTDLEVVGNTFLECAAGVGSGANVAECMGVLFEANKFYKNRGGKDSVGGGLMVSDSQSVYLLRNDFRGNKAATGGGAMLMNSQKIASEENLFFQNSAQGDRENNGGGLVVYKSRDFTSLRDRFIGNSADNGGGLLIAKTTGVRVSEAVVSENSALGSEASAGGGLYASDAYEALVENSRFENNMAVLGGGASVFSCPKVRLVGNAFAGNSARGAGGGLSLHHSNNALVEGNTFTSNVSVKGGGMLLEGGRRVQVRRNTFNSNQAAGGKDSGGGALIILESKQSQVSENTFKGNVSVVGSGIALMDAKGVVIKKNRFKGNSAIVGTVAFFSSSDCKLDGNAFEDNEYKGEREVIVSEDSEVSQLNNEFS